jgi:hypothetical protein
VKSEQIGQPHKEEYACLRYKTEAKGLPTLVLDSLPLLGLAGVGNTLDSPNHATT